MRTKIETAAGTIVTTTTRRFVAVESRDAMFVARTDRFVRICAGHDRADVEERARVEAVRRGFAVDTIAVDAHKAVGRVVRRSDSFEVARREAAKVGGFVFDTVTGERV